MKTPTSRKAHPLFKSGNRSTSHKGRVPATILASLVILASPVMATNVTWDSDTNFSNGVTNGAGTWNTSGLNWRGTSSNAAWVDGNTAVFGVSGSGGGSVTVSGNMTLGGLIFNTAGYTLTGGSLTLSSPTITANVAATISSVIQGTTGLTKSGTGTLILGGANTYTGTTTIGAGTLQINNASALSGGGDITFTGGTLQHTSVNKTDISARIKNSTSAVSIDTNGQAVTYASAWDASNTGGLTKLGTGTLTWSNASGLSISTGIVTIDAGTLAFTKALTLTSGTVSTSAGATGTLSLGAANGFVTSSGTFTKAGAGILTLAGAGSYSGPTLVKGGVLLLGSATILPNYSTAGNITVGSGATIAASSSWSAANIDTLRNAATYADNTASFGIDTTSAALTYASNISGAYGLNKLGSNTLTLTGNNSYTGVTTISNGTLALGSANALGGPGNITFNGGTLQYGASNTADYSSRIKNSASAINIDLNGQDITYNSAIDSSNTGGLGVSGSGSMTLKAGISTTGALSVKNAGAGNTSTFTLDGGTSSVGSLNISPSGSTGTWVFNIQNSATLTVSGAAYVNYQNTNAELNVSGNSTVNFNGELGIQRWGGGTASFNQSGGTVNVASTLYIMRGGGVGTLNVSGGLFNYTGASWAQNSNSVGTVTGTGATYLSNSGTITITSTDLNVSNWTGGTGILGVSGGTLNLGNNYLKVVNSGAGSSAAVTTGTVSISGGTVNTKGIYMLGGATQSYGDGYLTVTGGVTNIGSGGIANLGSTASNNTYAINLSGGTVGTMDSAWTSALDMTLNNSAANGTDDSGNITFRTTGTNGTTAYGIGLSGVLSGAGGLNVNGLGALTLSAANTYSGATTVKNGTLTLASAGSIYHSSSVKINSGATLDVSAHSTAYEVKSGQSFTNNGNIKGDLAVTGILNGSGTVNGDLTVNGGGTLAPGNSPGIQNITGALTLLADSKLEMQLRTATSGDSASLLAGTDYDQVTVGGQLTLEGTLALTLGGTVLGGDIFTLILNSSELVVSGSFANITANGNAVTGYNGSTFSYDGLNYQLVYSNVDHIGTEANDLQLVVVPEPSTWAMLLGGMGMLIFGRRIFRREASVL